MSGTNFIQVFIKLIDSKTLTLQFPTHQTLSTQSIKQQIETLTQIPVSFQNLILNGKFLSDSIQVPTKSLNLSTIYLTFSLLGGKGGFGSLLRGAATKAGQKKTNNFDACRDMSGRRLRHVNAEKRLEDWKAEQEERKLEKVAEEYLKKMVKKGKGGKKEQGAEKYVEKYREESARCVQEVERSVRESMGEMLAGGKKRKLMEKLKGKENVDAKKLKVWMGKRKLDESDTDDSEDDQESDDSDTENEKSVITNKGNQSDSSRDGSSGSASVPQLNVYYPAGSSDSGSDEEKVTATGVSTALTSATESNIHENGGHIMEMSSETEEKMMNQVEEMLFSADMVSIPVEFVTEKDPNDLREANINSQLLLSASNLKIQHEHQLPTAIPECDGTSEYKSSSVKGNNESCNVLEESQPLNFDDYNSAAELEVLGLERLKSELQAHGLKCGGTLQERAARLFLHKTTPVEKLPKKLLARK